MASLRAIETLISSRGLSDLGSDVSPAASVHDRERGCLKVPVLGELISCLGFSHHFLKKFFNSSFFKWVRPVGIRFCAARCVQRGTGFCAKGCGTVRTLRRAERY